MGNRPVVIPKGNDVVMVFFYSDKHLPQLALHRHSGKIVCHRLLTCISLKYDSHYNKFAFVMELQFVMGISQCHVVV